MSGLHLNIITVSTRPGRAGLTISDWFYGFAKAHASFTVDRTDLAELNLPFLDEPHHPMLGDYLKEHTKAWSKTVAAADAFVFVTPEYNYSMPAPLVNAVDYLSREWAYKPAGFVSYGGVSGGTRSVQMAKQLLTSVRIMPLPEGVALSFFRQHFDEQQVFHATTEHEQAAKKMLDELLKWATALQPLRNA